MNAQPPLTARHLEHAIRTKAAQWIETGQAVSTYEINNGQCEDFAESIVGDLGGASSRFFSLDALELCLGNDDFKSHWDVKLIRRLFPKSRPTYGLTFRDIAYDVPSHVWVVLDKRHYDAECPMGVDNFFELPLIARGLQKLAAQKAARRKRSPVEAFIAETAQEAKALPLRVALEPFPARGANAVLLTDLFAKAPGQGAGTQFMRALATRADKRGIAIYLMPDTPRNRAFYRRFDFVDAAMPGYMVRLPEAPSFMR